MLYLVGTAIGNIEDTTMRALRTLIAADIILAEDTRSFGNYYQRIQELFNIFADKEQKIQPFHDQNEFEQISSILEDLTRGKNIALVSESGMPLISDPGKSLLSHVIKAELPFTVIPGATAFVSAAVLSGFDTNKLIFIGFLPKKESEISKLFTHLRKVADELEGLTVVFYESPHRINKTLEMIDQMAPNAEVCITREITKQFEETIRGKASEIKDKAYKGELTVALRL